MLFGILMWIVISLVPLQTSPEFVVHEIEACCHHRIALQCSGDEHMKIVVVQARYVIDQEEQIPATASSSHPHYQIPALEHNATVAIPRPSASASDNQPLPRNPRTISLWDLDIKFVHDLINENLPHPVHINAPPWHSSHISHFADKQRFHYPRVTIPPIFYKHGLNFTSSRVIEMPPYHLKFLDKDTIWREPLFSIGQSESSIMSSNSYVPYKKVGNVGGSVGKRSHHQQPRPNEQVPSTETNTESGAYDYDDQQGNGECWSYEALSSTSATFTTDSSKIKPPWHFKDLRAYFNQRCSGRSKCTVELVRGNQPDPDVTKLCHLLPEGKVTVKYLCYNSSSEDVHSRCNVDVMPAKEGFLHNPGYPDLYPGDEPCQWRLHVPQQKILLVFFDISLRGQEKSTCRDKLVASEEHSKLLSTCGDHSSAVAVLSESHKLNVTLIPQSRLAFPKRGFLIYYRVLGCRDPVRPKNSYVVFRNATHAYIICDLGHLNPDTLTRERWLYCNPLEHTWTGTILDCQDVRSYSNTMRNLSIAQVLRNDPSVWPVKLRPKENVMSDFIIPVCVIISLFFINGIILFFICRARRRQPISISENGSWAQECDQSVN
ncbi:unnamed protein product [Orchesella dallaii]|uniref:CUB domain-containing protein n=1 Tax=Orchesella dallaii TaxID=48710 RepID=A0ABP1QGA1_9HEXA